MRINIRQTQTRDIAADAFTLMEVMITVGISTTIIGAILYGFVVSARNLEWAAFSLQAQANVIERMEQTYSIVYKPQPPNPNDNLIVDNFPATACSNVLGTNFTYISDNISEGVSNQFMKMIRVDCVWVYRSKVYTNSVSMLRAPDP
jgi:type II secretory pathway pseudopilin PulG